MKIIDDEIKVNLTDKFNVIDAKLGEKTVTENGEYLAGDDRLDGYHRVSVTVEPKIQEKSIKVTENGVQKLTADEGFYGLKSVEIDTNVPLSIPLITTLQGTATADIEMNGTAVIKPMDYEKLATPSELPTDDSYGCAWLNDGTNKYLAVVSYESPYILVYSFDGTTLTKLADPIELPTGHGTCCAWLNDGTNRYLAVAHNRSPYITVYSFNGTTLTKLANPSSLPMEDAKCCAWLYDGTNRYLAVGHSYRPYITVYSFDGTTLTKLANPSTLPTGDAISCDWLYDGTNRYLAVTHYSSPYITVYSFNGTTLTKLANPSELPYGIGNDCAWLYDGTNRYLAVLGYEANSKVYSFDGTTFTKIGTPSCNLTTFRSCAWLNDGKHIYFATGHTKTPYIAIYLFEGNRFIKLDNPSQSPFYQGSYGNGCDWLFDGENIYLALAHDNKDYIIVYKCKLNMITPSTRITTHYKYAGYCPKAIAEGESGEFNAVFEI